MENIFISTLELVKCTYKCRPFYEKMGVENVMLINEFLETNDIKLKPNLILTDSNFKLVIINKNNNKYNTFENKIGNIFSPKIVIDDIINYINESNNKPQIDYLSALKCIMVETECLQNENINNNNLNLTEYLSDNTSDESNDSNNMNTINFDLIDTIKNI
jgi:hypothetical protein